MRLLNFKRWNEGIQFLKEVRAELTRVTWPTREMVIGGTVVVFLVSLFLVIYMGVLDFIITKLLGLILR